MDYCFTYESPQVEIVEIILEQGVLVSSVSDLLEEEWN